LTNLLHIDSSPLGEGSVTRRLTRDFVTGWRARCPATRVLRRDLTDPVPPHLDEAVLTSFWTGETPADPSGRAALSLSDAMIGELEAADLIVVGSPMYNFSVTSTLKAWMDLVGRAGRTFRYTDTGVEGLMGGRRAVVITARGGYYRGGGPTSGADHQAALLDTYFRFLGLDDVFFVHAEGQGMEPEAARAEEARAREQIRALVSSDALEAVA
jgi:FMN-dependent NADH-azoreductase